MRRAPQHGVLNQQHRRYLKVRGYAGPNVLAATSNSDELPISSLFSKRHISLFFAGVLIIAAFIYVINTVTNTNTTATNISGGSYFSQSVRASIDAISTRSGSPTLRQQLAVTVDVEEEGEHEKEKEVAEVSSLSDVTESVLKETTKGPISHTISTTSENHEENNRDSQAPICPWSSIFSSENLSDIISWSIGIANVNLTAPALEGSLQLHIKGCDLSWTPTSARQCLKKLGHVVMAGDSITRLQYISLIHWLHTESWSPKDSFPPGDSPRHWARPPAPEDEGPKIDFFQYFQTLSNRLEGAEICDCIIGGEHIENRYYNFDNLRVSYVGVFKYTSEVVLHDLEWLNATCDKKNHGSAQRCAQSGCLPGNCNEPSKQLRILLPQLLTSFPQLLQPDVLILNVGVHLNVEEREMAENLNIIRDLSIAMTSATRRKKISSGNSNLRAWRNELTKLTGVSGVLTAPITPLALAEESHEENGADTVVGATLSNGGKRGLVWKVTTPGKFEALEKYSIWKQQQAGENASKNYHLFPGIPFTLPGPWPKVEESMTRVTREGGGRVFDTHALLYPLITALTRAEIPSGAFAHSIDAWHFAPTVNAELNKAMLSMLCEEDV